MEMQASSRFAVESGDLSSKFDDDGKKKRTGIYISLLLFQYIQLSTFHSSKHPNIFLEFHFIDFFLAWS